MSLRVTMSRSEARVLGEKTYYTGKPCKYGHFAERSSSHGECRECHRLRSKEYAVNNQEENKERIKRPQDLEKKRAAVRAWKKKYPEKSAASTAARDKRVRDATPAWASREAIKEVYARARLLTVTTGIKHVVDHLVPVRSPLVCGLHVEFNLEAIPEGDNLSKSNRWWKDGPPGYDSPTTK